MAALEQIDRLVTLYLNLPAGRSLFLDSAIYDVADSTILKGGIFLAFYWWMWFDGKYDRGEPTRRREVIVALIGATIAVVISRLLQVGLPFHNRPLHTAGLPLRVPLSIDPETLNTFSSFPSDHAVLFFALAVPLWMRSRWLGAAAGLWTILVICLPRIYLGYHWPSDVLAGAVIGVVLMLVLRRLVGATKLPDRLLVMGATHPAVFYALSWLIILELAVLFYDLRHFALDAVRIAKMLVA